MKGSSQRRNDPDRDDFWKFIGFLYFFFSVSKALAADPIKRKGKKPWRKVSETEAAVQLLYNFIEIALRHGCFPVNLLHIFRTPFLKNSNFIEITLRYGCSPVNLLHVFRTLFLKNTSGWLLLLKADWNTCIRKKLQMSLKCFLHKLILQKKPLNVFPNTIKLLWEVLQIS